MRGWMLMVLLGVVVAGCDPPERGVDEIKDPTLRECAAYARALTRSFSGNGMQASAAEYYASVKDCTDRKDGLADRECSQARVDAESCANDVAALKESLEKCQDGLRQATREVANCEEYTSGLIKGGCAK